MFKKNNRIVCPNKSLKFEISELNPLKWLIDPDFNSNFMVFEVDGYIIEKNKKPNGIFSRLELEAKNLDDIDLNFLGALKGFLSDDKINFKYDIQKAKEIWLNQYRRVRTPLIEKLDLEYMRADEQGNLELKKEIASKKQALRDVTKTELPNTLEEIKATWPEILGQNPFNK